LGRVIFADFSRKCSKHIFWGYVYSIEIKKYQFAVSARTIEEAYKKLISLANQRGVNAIQCVALFHSKQPKYFEEMPECVWHLSGTHSRK
jgi:hypothetical protein